MAYWVLQGLKWVPAVTLATVCVALALGGLPVYAWLWLAVGAALWVPRE